MSWFWEYDQTTTLETIRNDMKDQAKCIERIKNRPADTNGVRAYDCLAGLILGGDKFENYYKNAWNYDGNSSWTANLMNCFAGKSRTDQRKNYDDFCKLIDESFSLQKLHTTILNYNGFNSGDKNIIIIWLTTNAMPPKNAGTTSNSSSGTAGGNTMSNVFYIIGEYIEKKNNKQVIFTGAPGTGKTYAVTEFVKKMTGGDESRYRFVQFHSSYDYTDFVEGLRPVPDGNGGNMFVRMDGIFKEFCRHIVEKNLDHLKNNMQNPQVFQSADTYYEYMKNVAKKEAREDVFRELDKNPYFFIIDEINRADLGKVFGELMYGFEESYREVHNRFDTQYKNLPAYEMEANGQAVPFAVDCFKNGFFVPYNLYIIGTMNDIDRSVESFDFALRRRFIWVDIKANEVMEESLKSMRDNAKNKALTDTKIGEICTKIIEMNNAISSEGTGLNESFHIGPAYFKELVKASDADAEGALKNVFDNRIEPILREYTRGRKTNVTEGLIKACADALGIVK